MKMTTFKAYNHVRPDILSDGPCNTIWNTVTRAPGPRTQQHMHREICTRIRWADFEKFSYFSKKLFHKKSKTIQKSRLRWISRFLDFRIFRPQHRTPPGAPLCVRCVPLQTPQQEHYHGSSEHSITAAAAQSLRVSEADNSVIFFPLKKCATTTALAQSKTTKINPN